MFFNVLYSSNEKNTAKSIFFFKKVLNFDLKVLNFDF